MLALAIAVPRALLEGRTLNVSSDRRRSENTVSVAIAEGKHPVPSRTRKLSPPAPMVLPGRLGGRVGRRRNIVENGPPSGGPFSFRYLVRSDDPWPKPSRPRPRARRKRPPTGDRAAAPRRRWRRSARTARPPRSARRASRASRAAIELLERGDTGAAIAEGREGEAARAPVGRGPRGARPGALRRRSAGRRP